jgi:3-phosphoshikimate 1-carboxyvinyltransferase
LHGAFRPPGDKSITHRALILALLASGRSVIETPNPGLDCAATRACTEALGARIGGGAESLEVTGRGLELLEPDRVLECGNSGTTLRLLAGVVASQPFLTVLSGDHSLNRRPVARVVEPLRRMGARLSGREHDRFPPLVVQGGDLHGIEHELPVASAQAASAVLLAGLGGRGPTSVTLPGAARDHTERMLEALGVPVGVEEREGGGRRVTIDGGRTPIPFRMRIPGDPSAAAFLLAGAAALPGSEVTARDVSLNPTRTGFLDVLEGMGATVRREPRAIEAGEPVGDVTVTGPARLSAFNIPEAWVPRMIDEVPAWAMVAACAHGNSRLAGAAELRIKESDRLSTIARNLGALGITAREAPDGLEIEGGVVRGGAVDAAGDHRIAMAFAMLGSVADAPVEVADAENIATSFPGFDATLSSLGGRIGSAVAS